MDNQANCRQQEVLPTIGLKKTLEKKWIIRPIVGNRIVAYNWPEKNVRMKSTLPISTLPISVEARRFFKALRVRLSNKTTFHNQKTLSS